MVDIHPEGGGAVQKAADLAPVVVEIAGAPLAVAHVAVVLVEIGAVEAGQSVSVGRKVDGNKIHNDANAHPVTGVDEGGKLGRAAVPAGDGEIPGGLVAPAAVKGMLGQGQQLHMGEVVVQQPGDQFPGQLLVIVPAVRAIGLCGVGFLFPAARVELVDIQGQVAAFVPPLHPGTVVKAEVQPCQAAGGAGAQLGGKGIGVGVEHDAAVRPVDPVFVEVALGKARNEAAPQAGVGFFHGHAGAPAIKAAADLHGGGTGGPDVEPPALFPMGALGRVRAEDAVSVKAFANKKALGEGGIHHAKDSLHLIF